MVTTQSGDVEGYTAFSVNHYLGIPFAAPPVGSLRFAPPTAPASWSGTRHCFLHGNICPQEAYAGYTIGDEDCLYLNVYSPALATPSSRLPVLVWLYGGAFVFGDGYEFGLYSATNIAAIHQLVVVTFNYRLAGLGFLALDALRRSSPANNSGNTGILDQLAVLRWVRDNIAGFGGDPSRVTLAGESAGAISVCLHLTSEASRGLFHAAVMESGVCDSATFFVAREQSIAWSVAFAHSLGCHFPDSDELVRCLQQLPAPLFVKQPSINVSAPTAAAAAAYVPVPAAAAVDAADLHRLPNTLETVRALYSHRLPLVQTSLPVSLSVKKQPPLPLLYPDICWAPTVDSAVLSTDPLSSIRSGDWAHVPLIVGTNRDEGTIFLYQLRDVLPGRLHDPLVPADLPVILSYVFTNDSVVARILQHYPTDQFADTNNRTAAILRDWSAACSRRPLSLAACSLSPRLAAADLCPSCAACPGALVLCRLVRFFACPSRRLAAAVSAEGRSGVWLYEFDYLGDWVEDSSLGVYHSSELEFVFDNAWPPLVHDFSARDQDMADSIGRLWSNLAYFHDPNGGDGQQPLWPQWEAQHRRSLRLAVPLAQDSDLHGAVCDFWDQLVKDLGAGAADLIRERFRRRAAAAAVIATD